MTKPAVSVIMPVFNAEKYIEEAVESVLRQTFYNWELIITDDGSTDRTSEILKRFKDPRIKIITQKNKGPSAARNAAMQKMSGKYFTFLDADDQIPLTSLQYRFEFAEKNLNVSFVAGNVSFFNDNNKVSRIWKPDFKGDPFQKFVTLDEKVFCNPSLFIRHEDNIIYHFNEAMTHVEDLLFFTSIAQQSVHRYDFIDEEVYRYRIHNNSAMKNLTGLELGYWKFYNTVKMYPNVDPKNVLCLKRRIIRIMMLSYLRAGEITNSVRVISKLW